MYPSFDQSPTPSFVINYRPSDAAFRKHVSHTVFEVKHSKRPPFSQIQLSTGGGADWRGGLEMRRPG